MRNVKLDNSETIAYYKYGNSKQKCILLHGNLSTSYHMTELGMKLSQVYEVYIPDMRGFGNSSYINEINTISDLADDIINFIEILKLEDVIIVGWSFGGAVAMQVAIDGQDNISKLVLIDSVGISGDILLDNDKKYDNKEQLALNKQVVAVEEAILNKNDEFIKSLYLEYIFTNHNPNDLVLNKMFKEVFKQRNYTDVTYALSCFNISNKKTIYSEGNSFIDKIKSEVIVIHGHDDQIFSKAISNQIYDSCKTVKSFKLIDNAGHCPFVDKIDEVVKLI